MPNSLTASLLGNADGTPIYNALHAESGQGITGGTGLPQAGSAAPAQASVTISAELLALLVANMTGQAKDAASTLKLADGSTYTGDIKDGKPHGNGILIYSATNAFKRKRYEGEFIDGIPHGQGYILYSNGDEFRGEIENNKLSGKGVCKNVDGKRYEGMFENGKYHGEGVMTFPNFDVYTGEWRDNKANGRGKLTYRDGTSKVGEWRNNNFWSGKHYARNYLNQELVSEYSGGKENSCSGCTIA
ncbi:MAG: repeat-containing protein 1 [Gammaproteobacteria bacterium]|jgi:hypothetical protein|nr:repeat-containing protein 1 [Gammaproteobacteria bacterium]